VTQDFYVKTECGKNHGEVESKSTIISSLQELHGFSMECLCVRMDYGRIGKVLN